VRGSATPSISCMITSGLMRKILEIPVFMLARGRRRNEIDAEAFDPASAQRLHFRPYHNQCLRLAHHAKGTEATGLRDGRHELRLRTSASPASTIR
jgi:hypothetical protein